ncbi:hypothetical protein [Gymnodinialimonas hymeniacidonis]|uniref:hypothetical protein n=1 Tax=Gymnodinialimonas hymeniacidonis TaxID=3126508 RepID=UPI0034C60544
MAREPDTDAALDALFAEAKAEVPDDALMARVLADAHAVQAERERPVTTPVAPQRGWLARIAEGLGGWGAFGGVTAAGVMGLAIGLFSPDAVSDLVGTEVFGLEAVSYEITPDMGALWLEVDDV